MKSGFFGLLAACLLSMPVVAATAEKVNRRSQFDTAIVACESFLAEQGLTITLPRPPERPSEEQREAIKLCQDNDIIPKPHHRGEGRPPGPPPHERFEGEGRQ